MLWWKKNVCIFEVVGWMLCRERWSEVTFVFGVSTNTNRYSRLNDDWEYWALRIVRTCIKEERKILRLNNNARKHAKYLNGRKRDGARWYRYNCLFQNESSAIFRVRCPSFVLIISFILCIPWLCIICAAASDGCFSSLFVYVNINTIRLFVVMNELWIYISRDKDICVGKVGSDEIQIL